MSEIQLNKVNLDAYTQIGEGGNGKTYVNPTAPCEILKVNNARMSTWEAVKREYDISRAVADLGIAVHGNLPISPTDGPHTVEYYISANSNNGKTITKPITASQGGYFTFTYNDGNPEFDSTMFDFDTEPMPMEQISFPFGSNWLTEDTTEDGSTTTGIVTMSDVRSQMSDAWYSLDGRKLSSQPTKPGVYIHCGKKVVLTFSGI